VNKKWATGGSAGDADENVSESTFPNVKIPRMWACGPHRRGEKRKANSIITARRYLNPIELCPALVSRLVAHVFRPCIKPRSMVLYVFKTLQQNLTMFFELKN
jgi:hypothetical protein